MNRPAPRGPQADLKHALLVWLAQHLQALIASIGQAVRYPVSSLLTTAVIGISLALPAGFYLLLENAGAVLSSWGSSAQLALFLNLDVPEERARNLAGEIRGHPQVAAATYLSRAEVLEEYRRMSGFREALEALTDNPLPAVILVQPRTEDAAGDVGERLLADLRQLAEVDAAQYDRQWVQRLYAIMDILERAVLILATLLALGVLLIVGNTIRLAIFNRRAEIEINILFGATNAFIQRPYLYSGLMHGIGGALLAWLLVNGALQLLSAPAARLAELYLSDFALSGLRAREVLCLLATGGALGVAGSWIAVQRHLRTISPF